MDPNVTRFKQIAELKALYATGDMQARVEAVRDADIKFWGESLAAWWEMKVRGVTEEFLAMEQEANEMRQTIDSLRGELTEARRALAYFAQPPASEAFADGVLGDWVGQ
jgi:hypothetical protein